MNQPDVNTAEDDYAAGVMAERPKLYYQATFADGCVAVLDPGEVDWFIKEADSQPVGVEKIYLTDAEYEAIPEFES
jgi:hypothetical protein